MPIAAAALLVATTGSLYPQSTTPRDILVRFCDLDAQGEQLDPDGSLKAAALFASPSAPRRDRIMLVRDFVVSSGFCKG
jgi:hypothetical protein